MNMFKTTDAKTADEYIELLDEPRKSEIKNIHQMILKTVPKLKPFIISGMIGYGKYHYKSKTREGEWAIILLASQKNYISLYACGYNENDYVAEKYAKELSTKDTSRKHPKVSVGKSCIRFKSFDDVDLDVLKIVLKEAEKYPMSTN